MKPTQFVLLLDKLAEDNGITPAHLTRHPAILAGAGLEPEDVDPDTLREVNRWQEHEMRRIRDNLFRTAAKLEALGRG